MKIRTYEALKALTKMIINQALLKAVEALIPPFLTGCGCRTYAAIFGFWAGVMPPMPIFGRSLL